MRCCYSAMHACHCTILVQRISHTNSYYAHVVTNDSSYSMCVSLKPPTMQGMPSARHSTYPAESM